MHRVLLLLGTATYRASAFLRAAERLGLPVVVGSDRPQSLARANPGGHLTLDFGAPEHAAGEIVGFAREHPLGAIVPADDDGVILAATAAGALGLDHNPVEGVKAARDKHRMREMLSQAGLPGPRFASASTRDDPLNLAATQVYPCVVKPTTLSASRGVIRADTPEQFVTAFRRLAAILEGAPGKGPEGRGREILVEEYLPGVEVAVEGILTRGALRVLALFDKPDPLEGPFFEESIYVTPSRLPREECEMIGSCVQQVASTLGLTHGPVHAEVRLHEGRAWMLEIAPRSIGGLCARTLRFGRGVSLEELILRQALGQTIDRLEREEGAAGVMMIPIPAGGLLREIRGREDALSIPGVEDLVITIPVGQPVVAPPEGDRYLGFLFARAGRPAEAEAALREAHSRLTFIIDPLHEAPEKAYDQASGGTRRREMKR